MDPQETHKSAKTLGIVSLITGFLCWPAGIICGHISLSKFKKLGEAYSEGKGLALAGTIIGYVNAAITIAYIIFLIVVATTFATSGEFQDLNGL